MRKLKLIIALGWRVYELITPLIILSLIIYYQDEAPLLFWVFLSYTVAYTVIEIWTYRDTIFPKLKRFLKKFLKKIR